MSVRGPRGGRGSGRGAGRGRGRGSKTTTWEWHNNYSPGPAIYDQLWHVRKEPATVTPFLPTECPLPDATSQIIDRRQTEGEVQRNFYVVEVTNFNGRESSMASVEDEVKGLKEVYHVDLSRILEYVSPEELERFENEQFRIEAKAEAVAMRIEAEELARRRLEKNARAATGPGSRMFNGLGSDGESRTQGRPRGRGRRRGRGSWRGRGALTMNNMGYMREELVDTELEEAALHREEEMQLIIAETDSEEDDLDAESRARTSPTMARSALVANSALPISPILSYRLPSGVPVMQRDSIEASDDDESDLELIDGDARSMSNAAMQLLVEDDDRGSSIANSEEDAHSDSHCMKRRRTESTALDPWEPSREDFKSQFGHTNDSGNPSPRIVDESDGSGPMQDILHSPPHFVHAGSVAEPIEMFRSLQPEHSETELDNINAQSPAVDRNGGNESEDGSGDEDEDAEEYVVEAIIEHYREAGKKYYLVKWQGYEDSHDWLPEEDLEGAAELVAEYKEKVRMRKLKGKQKMTK